MYKASERQSNECAHKSEIIFVLECKYLEPNGARSARVILVERRKMCDLLRFKMKFEARLSKGYHKCPFFPFTNHHTGNANSSANPPITESHKNGWQWNRFSISFPIFLASLFAHKTDFLPQIPPPSLKHRSVNRCRCLSQRSLHFRKIDFSRFSRQWKKAIKFQRKYSRNAGVDETLYSKLA